MQYELHDGDLLDSSALKNKFCFSVPRRNNNPRPKLTFSAHSRQVNSMEMPDDSHLWTFWANNSNLKCSNRRKCAICKGFRQV